MSHAILITPHADDETLFSAYLAQQHSAFVACVYDEGREDELSMAMSWLGCSYVQLHAPKDREGETVETYMWGLRDQAGMEDWSLAIIPAEEEDGHEEHNIVARCAEQVFADVDLIRYTTYSPRGRRTEGGEEVVPSDPQHIARKLAALSCYRSQISDPSTRPWFYDLLDMREWIVR